MPHFYLVNTFPYTNAQGKKRRVWPTYLNLMALAPLLLMLHLANLLNSVSFLIFVSVSNLLFSAH